MKDLLQSSTQEAIVFGPLVSSSDHVSAVTGLGSGVTVTLSKNGGSFASPSGAISEIGNGFYKVAGNATDTNTLGPLIVHATGTGADPYDERFQVVSVSSQVANLPANVTQLLGTALTETSAGYLAAAFKKLFDVATPVLTSASVNQTQDVGKLFLDSGTLASATSGTAVLTNALGSDNLAAQAMIIITGGTGAKQVRGISTYTNSTKTIAIDAGWGVTPDATSTYIILGVRSALVSSTGNARSDLRAANGTSITTTTAGVPDCALTTAEHTSIASDVRTGMTAQGYTTTRGGYLDVLNGILDAFWAYATRTLTGFGFTVNTNANATETAIKAKTDLIATNSADSPNTVTAQSTITTLGTKLPTNAIADQTVLAAAIAALPTTTTINAVKAQTDKMQFDVSNNILASASFDTSGLADDVAAEVVAALDGATITLVSPLSTDGSSLTLTTGDSYTTANGQSLTFSISGQTALVGTIPHLRIEGMNNDLATAPAITSGTQSIVFNDITAVKTRDLTPGNRRYQVRFYSGSDIVTVLKGVATIVRGL